MTKKIVYSSVHEAELAKLFSNAWRYITFSIANQFFMMSENLDVNLSVNSLDQALTMQKSLNIKPETEPGITKDAIRTKLINHPQKDFWHSKMMWYGPCGIGTARGLSGFVDHHQLPFRLTFKERD